jgi:hypothetical protein
MKTIKIKYEEDIPSNYTGIIEYSNGNKEWYQDGKLHRVGGPAIIDRDGTKLWYQYGKIHRIDGPAVEYANGYKSWYQNDKLHRTNGPAREWLNGETSYWINGTETYKEAVEVFNALFPKEDEQD